MSAVTDPVVRSLVLQQGLLNAHISGDLCWWPTNGEAIIAHLPDPATVLLGMEDNFGGISHVAIGDIKGAITILSLPDLNHVSASVPHQAAITSMAFEINNVNQVRLISADAEGNVHITGDGLPRKGIQMRRVGRRITSIKIQKDEVILMSGWLRMRFKRLGEFNLIEEQMQSRRFTQTKLTAINQTPTQVEA